MRTFDYEQVGAVLAPLKAKFADCAHGEGNACEKLDKQLECCAGVCFEVLSAIRQWAYGVFSGEVIFDEATEDAWKIEAARILQRAAILYKSGHKAQVPCYELPGQCKLGYALWELYSCLEHWVTPKLSVGPSARVQFNLTDEEHALIQTRLSACNRSDI